MIPKSYLFAFIKYIQPTWYFNLQSDSTCAYWVNYHLLSEDDKAIIDYDRNYSTENASLRDAAYQAWKKGIIVFDNSKVIDLSFQNDIKDEYRFIKKYYSPVWSLVVLLIRLFTFHNPVKEFVGFTSNITTSKNNVYSKTKDWSEQRLNRQELPDISPLVSIIIPTLNRYKYLKDVLNDLEQQDYKNFEVLVCDQSDPIDEDFYKGWDFPLQLFQQEEKALWLARNKCIKASKGEYLLFYDDDSRVSSDWISNHIKCIQFFNVKISSGVSLSVVGGKIPESYSFFKWSDQIDTGNAMVHRTVFKSTGLFDRQFEKMRMGDGEFGLRCYLNGFANISNPLASRIHLKVGTGGLRHMGAWDAFSSKNLLSPLPIPSVLYLFRKYYGSRAALYNVVKTLPISVMPYKFKKNKWMSIIGFAIFILLLPKYMYQVFKSWDLSTKMLVQGPKIENFEL